MVARWGLCIVLALGACSKGRPSRDGIDDVAAALRELERISAATRKVPSPPPPACRESHPAAAVSPQEAGAASPSLAWGPGVVGLSYVRDDGPRSVLAFQRFVDGQPHGPVVELGDGAARDPTSAAWDGTSFVFSWGEPKDLVPEVYVGMVDAAGEVHWDASRLTETVQTGHWRTAGRTAVESKDARVAALGDVLLLTWRTRTFPEAHPLYFAAVHGLEVSPPVPVSAETDVVLDHQVVSWGDGAAIAYLGRFAKTQRQVRLARVGVSPPVVLDDWLVSEPSHIPDSFELAAVTVDQDLVLLWRGRTEYNSTSNVVFARVGPQGLTGPVADTTVVEGALVSNPQVNQPRRSFAVAPFPQGFVLAWSYQDDPDRGGESGLRLARYHVDGSLDGSPLPLPIEGHIARDPALARGAGGEVWYTYSVGDPPGERGRVYLGSVICGE
ncbi:MAG: hypothetical protein HY905_09975 [Deltaproteobacteria bacterium]|nr:hypothetical protein [Deltaproteobacteria bacterium]